MSEEAIRLLMLLLERYEDFFDSRGYLNSEGMKVLEKAARSLVHEEKWVKSYVVKARRRRSYEDILKLLEVITASEHRS